MAVCVGLGPLQEKFRSLEQSEAIVIAGTGVLSSNDGDGDNAWRYLPEMAHCINPLEPWNSP